LSLCDGGICRIPFLFSFFFFLFSFFSVCPSEDFAQSACSYCRAITLFFFLVFRRVRHQLGQLAFVTGTPRHIEIFFEGIVSVHIYLYH
jgi:hypothetical protein